MLNYIKSEFYRNFHRKYFIVLTGSISLLLLGLNILLFGIGVEKGIGVIDFMPMLVQDFGMLSPLVLILFIIDMVSTEEYKNGTLKNAIAFGMPRAKLVMCKFIVSLALFFLSMFIILVTFLASCLIIFGPGEHFSWSIVLECVLRWLAVVPLWISALTAGIFLSSIINRSNMFIYLYLGLFAGLPIFIIALCGFFKSAFLERLIMPLSTTILLMIIGEHGVANGLDVVVAEVIALIYTVLFFVLAIVCFSKKDIK